VRVSAEILYKGSRRARLYYSSVSILSIALLIISIGLLATVGVIRSQKSAEAVALSAALTATAQLNFGLSYLNLESTSEADRARALAIQVSDAVKSYEAVSTNPESHLLLKRSVTQLLDSWATGDQLTASRALRGMLNASEIISDELARSNFTLSEQFATLQLVFQWALGIALFTAAVVMYLIALLYISIHGVMKWNSEVMLIPSVGEKLSELPQVRIRFAKLFPGASQLALESAVISKEFAARAEAQSQLLKKNQRLSARLQVTIDELNESRDEFKRNAQLAAVGKIAGKVSHEINNPVTGVMGYLAFVRKRNTDADLVTYLDKAIREVERIGRIAKSLLVFSRHSAAQPMAPFELGPTIENVQTLVAPQYKEASVTLTIQPEGTIPTVFGRPDELQQCLLNLLLNARDALKPSPVKQVVIRLKHAGDMVKVFVEDTGPGIPPSVQEHLFQAFYTTKPAGQGSGLGLAVALELMERMGGKIIFDPSYTSGARFVLSVPVDTSKPVAAKEVISEAIGNIQILRPVSKQTSDRAKKTTPAAAKKPAKQTAKKPVK